MLSYYDHDAYSWQTGDNKYRLVWYLVINHHFNCLLQDTFMMGADYYQTESEIASLLAEGKVPIGIGQNTKIRYVDIL